MGDGARAEVVPTMQELGVDAMDSFTSAVELAGPVMDNVNRAGLCLLCALVCVCYICAYACMHACMHADTHVHIRICVDMHYIVRV